MSHRLANGVLSKSTDINMFSYFFILCFQSDNSSHLIHRLLICTFVDTSVMIWNRKTTVLVFINIILSCSTVEASIETSNTDFLTD